MSNPFLPIATVAATACTLENLISQYGSKLAELKHWKPGSPDYLPIQILTSRFQGLSHLQKLRTIHDAVDSLCEFDASCLHI